MNEQLLQYIWRHQLFHKAGLCTREDEPLEIIDPGGWNRDQGPDFTAGRIRIGEQEWIGNIELHVKTSDWVLHGHDADPGYYNVVLHVVWEHDVNTQIGRDLPVLELKPLVPLLLLERYRNWMVHDKFIPCENEIRNISGTMIRTFLEALLHERLNARASEKLRLVQALHMDWEEAFWRVLARGFGYKVNADAFEQIARTIPYRLILRHRHHPLQVEAMLLGQAGLLRTDNGDPHVKELFAEYCFLRRKYNLARSYTPVHFLRMRPMNFPTVRLAQLASLACKAPGLLQLFLHSYDVKAMRLALTVAASTYWDDHYRFGEPSSRCIKITGGKFIGIILLNTVLPFLAAYYLHHGPDHALERIADLMKELPPEENHVLSGYARAGVSARNAAESQSLLHLKNTYCDNYRCLECAMGKIMLRRQGQLEWTSAS